MTAAPTAHADLVIYRCTDASGAVTVQNDQRCPAGSREERRVIDDVPVAPPPPTPVPDIEPVAPVVAAPIVEAAPPPVELLPPPPLFQCLTWNKEPYLTERDTPARRCAPLRTVGLAGGTGSHRSSRSSQAAPAPVPPASPTVRNGAQRRAGVSRSVR